jgi:putative SOS response-associated peptidase YedK
MCGRYTMFIKPEELKNRFRATVSDEVLEQIAKPRYNLAPTQDVPIITMQTGERTTEMVRWGLIPSWAKDESIASKLINARAETLLEKPSFKNAFRQRRCLVIANGFYEWKSMSAKSIGAGRSGKVTAPKGTIKQPMYLRLKSGEPFAMAGLWEEWKHPETRVPVRSCTIITTEPNELIATLHHRMAVILSPSDEDIWLDDNIPTQDLLRLLRPFPSDLLEAFPVSSRVNTIAADEYSMIERVDEMSVEVRIDAGEQGSLFEWS